MQKQCKHKLKQHQNQVPNLSKIHEKSTPKVISFSLKFLDRFLMDFGTILGAKMEPKSMKKGVGKMMKKR